MQFGNLTLGTAAFGMPYGVANPPAPVPVSEVDAILDAAWEAGVGCVDTAPAYGEAERRLGAWMRKRQRRLVVISKMPSLRLAGCLATADEIFGFAEQSRNDLGIDCIDGYLAHNARDLQAPAVVSALQSLQQAGRIGEFGSSVYTVDEAEAVLKIDGLRLLQVPVNLIDHRFVDSGILSRCEDAGITVFARSVFLQGAFFLNPATVPKPLSSISDVLAGIEKLAVEAGCGIAALAFAFVRDTSGITSSVIGVYNIPQLRDLLICRSVPTLSPNVIEKIRALACAAPSGAIDPRDWS